MRLADDMTLRIGSQAIPLRASLRAATILEKRYGFERLFSEVAEGRLGTIADVVSVSANRDLLADTVGLPLGSVMPSLIEGVSRHVVTLAGIDADNPEPAATGETITFAEYHAKLYRIATGWLGWSPPQAWDATPEEILEAYNGHLEMLRAVHGGGPQQSTPDTPDKATFDREGLRSLKALGGVV